MAKLHYTLLQYAAMNCRSSYDIVINIWFCNFHLFIFYRKCPPPPAPYYFPANSCFSTSPLLFYKGSIFLYTFTITPRRDHDCSHFALRTLTLRFSFLRQPGREPEATVDPASNTNVYLYTNFRVASPVLATLFARIVPAVIVKFIFTMQNNFGKFNLTEFLFI